MGDILAQRLDRVDIALVQRLYAGTRCTEGVEQSDVDQVVMFVILRDETACFPRVQGHARICIDLAGGIAVSIGDEGDHLRIEFDCINAGCIVIQREQNVVAGAGAQNEDVRRA